MIKQFFKFCVVGTLGVSFNYLIFFILYNLGVYYLVSSAIGFILAIFLVFFLNKRYTFKNNGKGYLMIVKYFLVNLTSLVLGLVFLKLLVDILTLNVYLSNLFTLGLTTTSNFIGSKLMVFKDED